MEMGAALPEQFASVLRMDNAALSREEKSLVRARWYTSMQFGDASANMRSLFGSRGSGRRQDAMLTEEAAEFRASDRDLDVLAAHMKANKQGVGKTKREGPPENGGDKVQGGGQTLGGLNRKTGLRNRCYRCDSE